MGQFTTWRIMISEEMHEQNDAWSDLVGCTLNQNDLDEEFACHSDSGKPFTVWTKTRVYFSVHSSGVPRCESVPRHPCDEAVDLSFD